MLSRLGAVALIAVSFTAKGYGQAVPSAFLQNLHARSAPAAAPQSIELTGAAEWVAGSLTEHGTADLKAGKDGSSTLQLNLSTATRTETFSALDSSRSCQWLDGAGKNHPIVGLSCAAATPWFAPNLLATLSTQFPSLITVSDDGEVMKKGVVLHQISYIMNLAGNDAATTKAWTDATRVKVCFDLTTLLPVSLEYAIHPDSDDSQAIPVSVAFSDYRSVSGVLLPFHIERFVNRTLQLTLVLSNISIS